MDEAGARVALERLAAEAPPPSGVDIGLARRQGRRRLRWWQAGVPGASALAVIAIIGMFSGGLISSGPRSPGPALPAASGSGAPAAPLAAPAAFNPLIPYAAFGWLPAGHVFQTGITSPAVDYLTAGRKSRTDLSLSVYSAGTCDLSEAQILRQVQRHGHAQLNCGSPAGGTIVSLTGPVGAVHEQPAFWGGGYLAWQYARGGWAMLGGALARPDMLKIAAGARFGPGVMPAVAFPVQLTGALAAWQLHAADGSVAFMPYRGVLRANQWYLSHGKAEAMISEYVDPAPGNGHCPAPNRTVGGYRANVSSYPAARGNPPGQQLCAHADGLSVDIAINGWTVPNVVDVFAHDTRLLGPDPVNWTTRPLG
jgi:hypothetical protein